MSKFYDQTPNGDDALVRRLAALESEVRELRAGRRLEASTIGRGGITIQGGAIILLDVDGHEIGRMGVRDDLPFDMNGKPQSGFILRRNDGSIAFTLDDPNGGDGGTALAQFLKLQDATGNIIFSDDINSKFGLANPVLSYTFTPDGTNPQTWITMATGVAMVTYYTCPMAIFHPRISVTAYGQSAGGSGVTLRLLANGVSQGDRVLPANSPVTAVSWDVDGEGMAGGVTGTFLTLALQGTKTITSVGTAFISQGGIFGLGT